jgi:hypothetical protein
MVLHLTIYREEDQDSASAPTTHHPRLSPYKRVDLAFKPLQIQAGLSLQRRNKVHPE